MALPLIIGGLAAAGLGLAGNALSGGFSKPKPVQAVLPNDEAYKWGGPSSADMRQRGDQALQREAPKLDWSQANRDYEASYDARRQQQENVQDYRDVLSGKAPSLAQEQLKAGLDQTLKNAAATAAGARGSAQGLAARAAAFAGTEAGQRTAQDAAMLRAQEVAQARTGLTGALGQMRGQDFTARQGSQQQQQIISGNELDQRRLNDARSAMFWQSEMQKANAQLNAAMAQDAARTGGANAANQGNAAAEAAYWRRMSQMWGSLVNAGGGLMGQGIAAGQASAAQDKQHAHEKAMFGMAYGQPSGSSSSSAPAASYDWGDANPQPETQSGGFAPSSGIGGQKNNEPQVDTNFEPQPRGQKNDQYGTDDPNSPYYNPWYNKNKLERLEQMTGEYNFLGGGARGGSGAGPVVNAGGPTQNLGLAGALNYTPSGGQSRENSSTYDKKADAALKKNEAFSNMSNAVFNQGGLMGGGPNFLPPGAQQQPNPGQPNLDMGAGMEDPRYRGAGNEWIARMLNAPNTPGQLVKGGEFQTGRSVQHSLGPRAETIKAYLQNQSDSGTLAAGQGLLEGKAAQKAADASKDRAEWEEIYAGKEATKQKEFEDKRSNLFNQIGALQQQIQADEIDSNRFWKRASTADKIGAVFAVSLGAIGSAIAGQENLAMKKLDEAVTNDLRDQVANIDKKRKDITALQSIYMNAREALGDDKAAFALAKEQALRGVAARLDSDLGGIRNDQAVIKGEQLRGAILKEATLQKAAWEQAMLGQENKTFVTTQDKVVGGGGPSFAQRFEMAKFLSQHGYDPGNITAGRALAVGAAAQNMAAQNATVAGPDGTLYRRPAGMQDGQWAEVAKRMTAGNQAVRLANEIMATEDANYFATTGFMPTADSKTRRALAVSLQTAADEHAEQGQASEAALKNATSLLTGGGAKEAAMAMRNAVLSKSGDVVKSYGLQPVFQPQGPQQ